MTRDTINKPQEGKNSRKAHKGYDLSLLWKAYKEAEPRFHAPRGNTKLGSIAAWNILPVVTCTGEACATCGRGGCYAVKNALCHGGNMDTNNCLRAWAENTKLARTDLPLLAGLLDGYLHNYRKKVRAGKAPAMFRIHASGDFFSRDYAFMWYALAEKYYDIKFLAFTKAWPIIQELSASGADFYSLPNFSLVLSAWPGAPLPEDLREHYRVAWVQDGTETRIPEGSLECPGDCNHCGMCWALPEIGKDTYFHKH